MVLLFHILVAFGSLVAAGVSYISPSVAKLRVTYFLSASMLASGTFLVINNSSHLLEACVMGLGFLAVVAFAVVSAKNKLVAQASIESKN